MDQKPFFQAFNAHIESCGTPPTFTDNARWPYHGYFVNRHGDQFVFTVNGPGEDPVVRGGDCGWERPIRLRTVTAQEYREALQGGGWPDEKISEVLAKDTPGPSTVRLTSGRYLAVQGVILVGAELLWLRSCWEANYPGDSRPA